MREACEKASRGRYVRWGPFCCLDSGRFAGVVAGADEGTDRVVLATNALRAVEDRGQPTREHPSSRNASQQRR